jgi:alpha-galactosidase/6-phospho-beta-glucosidase family protein
VAGGGSVSFSMRLVGLLPGVHILSGIRLIDTEKNHTVVFDEVASFLIEQ